MSMTTSPFGTPVTDAPPAPVTTVEEVAEPKRRNVIILGAVAGALAVGAGAYFLLFAGGSDPEIGAAPVTPRSPRVVASAPAPAPVAPPIKKYVAVKARNPFTPLVSVPVAAAAPAGGTSAGSATGSSPMGGGTVGGGTVSGMVGGGSSGGTVGGIVSGGTVSGGLVGGGTVSGATPLPAAVPAPQVKIGMDAVSADNSRARMRVAGKTYTVKPLEEFGTYFKLLNLRDGGCGAVQYGDIVFDLCEGGSRTVS